MEKKRTIIIKNMARCKKCGDVIESKYRHDFVTCSCGEVSVDGGRDYLRRCFKEDDSYEDLSEQKEITEEEYQKLLEESKKRRQESYDKTLIELFKLSGGKLFDNDR